MEWLGYLILAMVVGAAGLAIYEHIKKRKMHIDGTHSPHDRARAAHTQAEQIRAEGAALQNPSSGFH
ncbi:MAG: hypothetical protein AB8B51_10450 [Sedimentitalea sp.]